MSKLKALLVVGVVALSLGVAPAARAEVSCDTEIGDWCKFMDFVCDTYPKVTHVVFAYCRG